MKLTDYRPDWGAIKTKKQLDTVEYLALYEDGTTEWVTKPECVVYAASEFIDYHAPSWIEAAILNMFQ